MMLMPSKVKTPADIAIESFARTLAEDIRNNPRALRSLRRNPVEASDRAVKALACDTVRLLKTPQPSASATNE